MNTYRRVAIALAVAAMIPAGVVLAKTTKVVKADLTAPACASKLVPTPAPASVVYNCHLTGKGGPATLTTALHLTGATISGTFTLKIKGKSTTYKIKGPIAADKNNQVTLKGTYTGAGHAKGTFETQAPVGKPIDPALIVIKGTL
jgi:hypothetical protein